MTDNLAYAKAGTLEPEDSDVQDESFSLADADTHTKEGEKWKADEDKKFIYDRKETSYNSTTKTNTSFTLKGWRKLRLSNGDVSLKAVYNLKNTYGNLYTWYTATAGSGTYSMDKDGTNAPSSICPRGWRLPQNDGNNSYNNLLFTSYGIQSDEVSSTKMRSSPLDFSFASYYRCDYGRVAHITHGNGDYWSSTVESSDYAYLLYFGSSNVAPQSRGDRADGLSVRCVARPFNKK